MGQDAASKSAAVINTGRCMLFGPWPHQRLYAGEGSSTGTIFLRALSTVHPTRPAARQTTHNIVFMPAAGVVLIWSLVFIFRSGKWDRTRLRNPQPSQTQAVVAHARTENISRGKLGPWRERFVFADCDGRLGKSLRVEFGHGGPVFVPAERDSRLELSDSFLTRTRTRQQRVKIDPEVSGSTKVNG